MVGPAPHFPAPSDTVLAGPSMTILTLADSRTPPLSRTISIPPHHGYEVIIVITNAPGIQKAPPVDGRVVTVHYGRFLDGFNDALAIWRSHVGASVLCGTVLFLAVYAVTRYLQRHQNRLPKKIKKMRFVAIGVAALLFFPLYEPTKPLSDFIAFGLGFLALGLAWRHVNELDELIEKLGTHLTQRFPLHLAEIIELVDTATPGDNLQILADCADYGSYSDPELHMKSVLAIRAAALKKVTVSILACGPLHHINRNSPLWGRPFEQLIDDEAFRTQLAGYLAFLRDDPFFHAWRELQIPREAAGSDSLSEWLLRNDFGAEPQCRFRPGDNTKAEVGVLLRDLELLLAPDGPIDPRTLTPALFEFLLYAREKFFEDVWLGTFPISDVKLPKGGLTFKRAPKAPTHLFFWLLMTPEKKPVNAVFMFTDFGETTRGLAFATREGKLLEVLASAFTDREKVI